MTLIHRIKLGFVNCYLLQNGDHSILVDAGAPGESSRARLLRKLSRYGLAPYGLDMVLLTHNHGDHTGAAEYLRMRGVPLAMHPDDAPLPRSISGKGPVGLLLQASSQPAIRAQKALEPDIAVYEGMGLEPYGIDATVLHIPGHTAGSVGLLFDDGRFVCGDTFMNFYAPRSAHIAEDFDALRQTAERLYASGITTVYPGHGKPFALKRK